MLHMYVTCILCANLCIGLQLKPLNIAATASKLLLCGCTLIGPVAHAREIASIPTTGFLFKDSLKVTSFNDPKVEGVALYIADIDRSITDKLHSDYFSDPSSSSIACTKSGPITLSKDVSTSAQGEEIFEEARNLFFKTIRVRRVYDKERNTLVYVSYSTRFDKNSDDNKSRFKSSMCVVPVDIIQ